jgi:hypothetical protein
MRLPKMSLSSLMKSSSIVKVVLEKAERAGLGIDSSGSKMSTKLTRYLFRKIMTLKGLQKPKSKAKIFSKSKNKLINRIIMRKKMI